MSTKLNNIKQKAKDAKKEAGSTLHSIGRLAKCITLESRASTAKGLYTIAEKIDISDEQESYCEQLRREMRQKNLDKKSTGKVILNTETA